MSNMYQEWNLLAEKIQSLLNVSTFLYHTFQINSSDTGNAMKKIRENANNNLELIIKFKNDFVSSLPKEALASIDNFISTCKPVDAQNTKDIQKALTEALLVNLALLVNDVSYYLNNNQIRIRKTVEIAFKHLQRQLVADKSVKALWEDKTNQETDFEKLGGAHLLLHKIWGFKVNAEGQRTDLVLSEQRIEPSDSLYQSVDGLILTEWKVVKNQNDLMPKINQAKNQAKKYASGVLGAIELSTHRYLVMVSSDLLDIPEDFIEDEITYRVINIAFSPKTPSKSRA
jgi:hypothetical protein